jgi:2-haloacid dehalogenase
VVVVHGKWTRRQVVCGIAGAVSFHTFAKSLFCTQAGIWGASPIRAIVFDAFVIFNPSNVLDELEIALTGNVGALFTEWRTRQFEYSWLRALSGSYVDFWQITDGALVWSARKFGLNLSQDQRQSLLGQYLRMNVWPDVPRTFRELKRIGLRLSLLSNLAPMMIEKNLAHSSLRRYFEQSISTDEAQTYKPHPGAYQLALHKLSLSRPSVLFVASAGWDAAGAKQFGYPTYWVNRLSSPMEELGAPPDGSGGGMAELLAFIRSKQLVKPP